MKKVFELVMLFILSVNPCIAKTEIYEGKVTEGITKRISSHGKVSYEKEVATECGLKLFYTKKGEINGRAGKAWISVSDETFVIYYNKNNNAYYATIENDFGYFSGLSVELDENGKPASYSYQRELEGQDGSSLVYKMNCRL